MVKEKGTESGMVMNFVLLLLNCTAAAVLAPGAAKGDYLKGVLFGLNIACIINTSIKIAVQQVSR